eukprot:TRINITY_DN18660_c0_g1_i1.p1 TRINITY_DN18660_c0_g1~~TRINITY_DN18660_c0_g1_i1.p1  ORF type:complete len:692 (+),score=149.91 TRINITY_DN18660_c0_g1_i1:164-2239(+)
MARQVVLVGPGPAAGLGKSGPATRAETEAAWASAVSTGSGHLRLTMGGRALDDAKLLQWCEWFEGYYAKSVARSHKGLVRDADFSNNLLTSKGVSSLCAMFQKLKLPVGSLKLHRNRIEKGDGLAEFFSWCDPREMHLSHNLLDTASARNIVLAAIRAANEAGVPRYPRSGQSPLWLRLEGNDRVIARDLGQELTSALSAMGKSLREAICEVTGDSHCNPGCCSREGTTPQVHLTYLRLFENQGRGGCAPAVRRPVLARPAPVPAGAVSASGAGGAQPSKAPWVAAAASGAATRGDAAKGDGAKPAAWAVAAAGAAPWLPGAASADAKAGASVEGVSTAGADAVAGAKAQDPMHEVKPVAPKAWGRSAAPTARAAPAPAQAPAAPKVPKASCAGDFPALGGSSAPKNSGGTSKPKAVPPPPPPGREAAAAPTTWLQKAAEPRTSKAADYKPPPRAVPPPPPQERRMEPEVAEGRGCTVRKDAAAGSAVVEVSSAEGFEAAWAEAQVAFAAMSTWSGASRRQGCAGVIINGQCAELERRTEVPPSFLVTWGSEVESKEPIPAGDVAEMIDSLCERSFSSSAGAALGTEEAAAAEESPKVPRQMMAVKEYVAEANGYLDVSRGDILDAYLHTAAPGDQGCTYAVYLYARNETGSGGWVPYKVLWEYNVDDDGRPWLYDPSTGTRTWVDELTDA